MPLPKGKSPGQGPRPNDPTRHTPATPPGPSEGQLPPTDSTPLRQHYQLATEGMEKVT